MPWEALVGAAATISATALLWYLQRKKDETKWRRLRHKEVPMWIVYRAYADGFPNKHSPIKQHGQGFFFKGADYEYRIEIVDPTIREPFANMSHMKVYQRRKR